MLLKIIRGFGNISKSLRNWGVKADDYVPWITGLIFLTNILFFGLNWSSGFALPNLVNEPIKIIVSIFSHANFFHLFSNMFCLVFFGPTVERYLGHIRFLIIYLLGGIIATFGFLWMYPMATIIGASGAISTVIMIYPFCHKRFIPALLGYFICFSYFWLQLIGSIQDAITPFTSVAHLAHVIGGLVGIVYIASLPKNLP